MGRYSCPYVSEGIYADLREVVSIHDRILKEHNAASKRIQHWLKIYFPEYLKVYKKFDSESGLLVLEQASLPKDIIALDVSEINKIWRSYRLRAVEIKRATTLLEAAHDSVEIDEGIGARMELQMLIADYQSKSVQLELVTQSMEQLVMQVPYVKKLLAIKGSRIRSNRRIYCRSW